MKNLEKIKEMLCAELEQYGRKGELTAGSLDVIHKLTDTIKNIDKIDMYEQYAEDNESSYAGRQGRGRNAKRDSMGRYASDGGYSGDHVYRSYDGGQSYDGRSYRGGSPYADGRRYSRDGARDYMIERIEDMMQEADPKSQEALKRCIKQIENA